MRIHRARVYLVSVVAFALCGAIAIGCSQGPQSLNPQPLPPSTGEPGGSNTENPAQTAGSGDDNGTTTPQPNSDAGEAGADGGSE